MSERLKRNYLKEEDFLEEFSEVVSVASALLNGDWQPDYDCSDGRRDSREYFRTTGELAALAFDSAAVYHDEGRFSSAQVVLSSSSRVVTVRVKSRDGQLTAETVKDQALSAK